MKSSNENSQRIKSRRQFISKFAATAALTGMAGPLLAKTLGKPAIKITGDSGEWLKNIKGSHRVVYDAATPNGIMPFAWPKVFIMTNEMSGTPASDCGVAVVLRHEAIPYCMNSDLWKKYHFGEVFKIDDPKTEKPSLRNPFWKPGPNDFEVPGIGPVPIGINQLQESGVNFGACSMAMTVYSAAIAQKMNLDPEEVKKEFLAGVLPGVQVVPSGVWALGRAQEKGCAYIYAGH